MISVKIGITIYDKTAFILATIRAVLDWKGAGYALDSAGTANPGYRAIPMLLALVCLQAISGS